MIIRIMPGRSLVIRKKVLVEKTLILCRVGIDAYTRERGCGAVGIRGWSESGPGTLTRLIIQLAVKDLEECRQTCICQSPVLKKQTSSLTRRVSRVLENLLQLRN